VANWWQKNAPDMLVYLRYINDNSNIFYNNPTSESKKELETTLVNLAGSFYDLFERKGPSVSVGNVVDELLRNFFGSFEFADYTQTEEGTEKIFN
jgi:hypothetical protein